MPNDLDLLMSRIEEINSLDPPLTRPQIEDLIANARRQRQLRGKGVKPSRSKVTIDELLDIVKAEPVPSASGIRVKL